MQARADFFRAQILFRILAATDGHAKNFSIVHQAGNAFRPTPLYDVISAHPVLAGNPRKKLKFAMSLKGAKNYYDFQHMSRKYWENTARAAHLPADLAASQIEEIQQNLPSVCEEIARNLPQGFPAEVSEPILSGMEAHVKRLVQ